MAENRDNDYEIDLSDDILQRWSDLCMNEEQSDVTFVIEGTEVPAHKSVLSAQCSYFRSLLSGGFVEATQNKIELEEKLEPFKVILEYIYTGRPSLAGLELDQVVAVLDLANKYDFPNFKNAIEPNLKTKLTLDNCCTILNAARLYSMDTLEDACLKFIDMNASEFLKHDTFKVIDSTMLCMIIQRDTFCVREIDIFHAVNDWYTANSKTDPKVFSVVRWPLLDSQELMDVYSEGLVDSAIQTQINDSRTATAAVQRIPSGTGCSSTEFIAKMFMTSNSRDTIIFKLDEFRVINNIKMQLIDPDSYTYMTETSADAHSYFSYTYMTEYSVDGNHYFSLVDHTRYHCHSWQNLYFAPCLVRFIRITGIGHDMSDLKVAYVEKMPMMIKGFVKPMTNMAKVELGARVIDGAGGDCMLNEYLDQQTYSNKNLGGITLQFNQPYYIGSIRFLLGSVKNYTNEFKIIIQTSVNNIIWKIAVDKHEENLSSWQEFDFEPQLASYIRIISTKPNVSVICSYFECPRNPGKPPVLKKKV